MNLLDLDQQAWEALCDGCGRCCLVKLEDEDSGEIAYTNVSCQFLDRGSCRCTDYANRAEINPRCVVLGRDNLDILQSMPYTCAYRLAHENRTLDTHPGCAVPDLKVSNRVVSEEFIHDDALQDHIIDWVSVYS